MSGYKTTVKRSIAPVKLTVTVTATRINENGTFSGLVVEEVRGPNDTFKAVCPPQGGGAMYLKVESLKGLTVLKDGQTVMKADKVKLF